MHRGPQDSFSRRASTEGEILMHPPQLREPLSSTALSNESMPDANHQPRFNVSNEACVPKTSCFQHRTNYEGQIRERTCSIRRDEGLYLRRSLHSLLADDVCIDFAVSTFEFATSCIDPRKSRTHFGITINPARLASIL